MAEPKSPHADLEPPLPQDLLLNRVDTSPRPGYDPNQSTPPGIPEYLETEIERERMQREARAFVDRIRMETEARELICDRSYKNIGRFIITRKDNYLSNKWAVELPQHQLGFDPDHYPLFDHEISKAFHVDALKNSQHLDHDDYEGLRKNIALVRNIVYRQFFPDGEFNEDDPKDIAKKDKIVAMGETIGKALKRGRQSWLPSFGSSISLADASEEDLGAARLYTILTQADSKSQGFFSFLGRMFNHRYQWNLKPISQTALSRASMQEYWNATELETRISGQHGARPSELIEQKSNVLENIATQIHNLTQFRRPQDMLPAQQILSVELAQKILKNFRVHLDAAKQVVGPDIPVEIFQYSEYLGQLSTLYMNNITLMAQRNPALLENAEFIRQAEAASTTIGKMSHILELKAMRFYAEEGNSGKVDEISRRILEPGNENWEQVSKDNLALLGEDLVKHVHALNLLMQKQSMHLNQTPSVTQALAAVALQQQKNSDISHDYQQAHQQRVAEEAAKTAAGLKNTWANGVVAQAPEKHVNTMRQMNQPAQPTNEAGVETPNIIRKR